VMFISGCSSWTNTPHKTYRKEARTFMFKTFMAYHRSIYQTSQLVPDVNCALQLFDIFILFHTVNQNSSGRSLAAADPRVWNTLPAFVASGWWLSAASQGCCHPVRWMVVSPYIFVDHRPEKWWPFQYQF